MSIPFLMPPRSLLSFGLVALATACSSTADAPPDDDVGAGNTGAGAMGAGAAASGGAGAIGATGGTPSGGTGATPSGGTGAAPSGGTGATPSGGTGATPSGGTGGSGGAKVFDAGTDPARNRVAPGTVCGRFATIQCAGEAYCCDNPGRNFDQCYQAQVDLCVNEVFLDIISENPITGYSVDAAETAFTEFERLASECDPAIARWATSSTGLRTVTLGTIAPGGDCSPPLNPSFEQAAAHAVACTNGDTTACMPRLVPPWTCDARQQAGGPCFTDLNCVDGHYCPNPDLDLAGAQCQARKADGQPCAGGNECQSLTCRGGSCVQATVQTAYCLTQQ